MAASLIEFTDANFSQEIRDGLVLVDFWAPWCGPCRFVAPVVEQLAQDYSGRVKVGKLNVDDHQRSAMTFRVMSIPTVILFKDGVPVETMVGAMSKAAYEAKLQKHVARVVS